MLVWRDRRWRIGPAGAGLAIVGLALGGMPVAARGASPFWLPPDFRGNFPGVAVAVGDSITLGVLEDSIIAARPYPAALEQALAGQYPGFRVLNRGQGGETTDEGLTRLESVLAADRPAFVLIMEGTNDANGGVNPAVVLGNLRAMVRLVKAHFAIPILGTIVPNFRNAPVAHSVIDAVNAGLPALAAQEGVRLVDTFSPLDNGDLYGDDRLHPTQAGYDVLGAAWVAALAAAIDDSRSLLGGMYVAAHLDFDGDGKADIAVYRPGTGEWFISRSSDQAVLSVVFGDPLLGDAPVPGDYDGDGTGDLAVYRGTTGEWFAFGSQDGPIVQPWGSPPLGDLPVPADYDGDGATDIAVYRLTTGQWFVRRSGDGGLDVVAWGAPFLGDVAVPGDYDGDGKADVAVYRPGTGEWFIFGSQDGLIVVAWGSGDFGDRPVPADYDGDTMADIAVFRTATGQWFVLRSSDGQLVVVAWGAPILGDVPVPGDFDGDGIADIAVYRQTTGDWFILESATGALARVAWGAPALADLPLPQPARSR